MPWLHLSGALAAIGHALAQGVTGFLVARSVLGVSEAGNFLQQLKQLQNGFQKRGRRNRYF